MSQKITIIKCNKSQKGTLNHQNRTGNKLALLLDILWNTMN